MSDPLDDIAAALERRRRELSSDRLADTDRRRLLRAASFAAEMLFAAGAEEVYPALRHTQGHRQEASRLLGWGRNTLTRKLKELGMDGEED